MALLAGFAMIFAWNGSVFACTLLLQGELGFSPLESGFALLPQRLPVCWETLSEISS